MQLRFEIPDSFWSLFRSVNREVYIEALLCINEEYQYSNYFLTREICIQALSDLYVKQPVSYTHLDVYKRQALPLPELSERAV